VMPRAARRCRKDPAAYGHETSVYMRWVERRRTPVVEREVPKVKRSFRLMPVIIAAAFAAGAALSRLIIF